MSSAARAPTISSARGRQRVVIGRPVHFVDDDPASAIAKAEASCAAPREPPVSARSPSSTSRSRPPSTTSGASTRESLVLIVDIGGGTSDFTVVRLGPERMARADRAGDVLATSGVHIGGTDFDQRLSLECVMPQLGFRHHRPARAARCRAGPSSTSRPGT